MKVEMYVPVVARVHGGSTGISQCERYLMRS